MHIKDFDGWNEEKKSLHNEARNLPYQPGEIWWCHIGINVGFEQDGTGPKGERPVVVVRKFNAKLCWVIPLSTSLKSNPYYVPVGIVDGKPASALISQMRPVDSKRLINLIGVMDRETFYAIRKAAKDLL